MEVWKDIPGYEGKYQASTEGRIRSVDHYVRVVTHGRELMRLSPGRVLRPGRYCKSGHLSVVLGRGTPGKPVHRLIALTFIGPPPMGTEVCHNDGDPTNNSLTNLRYDTRRNNILDVYKQGHRWRKLCISDVHRIRKLLEEGLMGSEIAKLTGFSQDVVSSIKTGRCYSWLH